MKDRHSVRTYDERRFNDKLLAEVQAVLQAHSVGRFGNSIRFVLVEREAARRAENVKLGTYGFIKGAPYFIAGIALRSPTAEYDFGYQMEQIVLKMSRLGLGTCWLGGTFSREQFGRLLKLHPGEWVPAIAALGHPAVARGRMDRLIRWAAKGDSRKPFEKLFFDGDPGVPLTREAAGRWFEPLEMVRLAPSASNHQPWRVIENGSSFHFFLCRHPGYTKWVPETDLQRVDIGIALSHFELAASHLGLAGSWSRSEPAVSYPADWEYVATWTDSESAH